MPARDLCAAYQADPTPFGRLTPIRRLRWESPNTVWLFRCECGNEIEATVTNVRPGRTQSCGCLKREQARGQILQYAGANRRPVALTGTLEVFRDYQFRARKKGLPFELTIEQFQFFLGQPCYICGALEGNTKRLRTGEFHYNGIDRLDNDLGYVDGNVAACCRRCNAAKNDMSLHAFLNWLTKLKGGY